MIFGGSEEVNMYIQILNPLPQKVLNPVLYLQILESVSPQKEFWIQSWNDLHQKYMTFAIIWPPINHSKTFLDRQTNRLRDRQN